MTNNHYDSHKNYVLPSERIKIYEKDSMNEGQSFALWKNIATFAPNMPCLSLCKRQTTACGTPVVPDSVTTETVVPWLTRQG